MYNSSWSEKDLLNKWKRELPREISGSLPWDVLLLLVDGLSDDTKLPRDILHDVVTRRDISGLFDVASKLDPTEYGSADLLLQDRIVVELFSKFDFPNSPFNKREKAMLRFFEAEELCRETSTRLSQAPLGLSCEVNSVIHRAIRHISNILGSFDLDAMLRFSRFGPGSSLCVRGPFTTEYFKLCERSPTVSTKAFPYAEALIEHDLKWKGHLMGVHPFDIAGPFSPIDGLGVELTITDHNKVAFVPKNAKTERSIAIEPYFNVYFQLGLGGLIRKRLFERTGVNLDSQLRNQALALKGSITGDLATIDFSMASDTISRETVELLLPPEWLVHLERLRSENYLLDGAVRPYHKFSSMGNGSTFELETLIFYAVALSACESLGLATEDITVFGDDVVLPSAGCELFETVCSYLGFKVNNEKSFRVGPFRESCGEDYLNGIRVRPVFCKELGTVQHVVSLANRLFELNRSVGVGSRCNDMLHSAVDLLHFRIPRDVRKFVVGPPTEEYDGHIHTTDSRRLACSPFVKWNRLLYCWEYPTIRFRARKLKRRDDTAALWLSWTLAQSQSPIPKPQTVVDFLGKLPGGFADISDFCQESVAREITGRKVGELSFGRNLVWSLGSDLGYGG